jgi:hypothetical protein
MADDMLDLDSPMDHCEVQPNIFPVDGCGLGLSHIEHTANRTSSECHPPSSEPRPVLHINGELRQWLDELKISRLGATLARTGLCSKEALVTMLQGLRYEEAQHCLKQKGVVQAGIRDRLLLAFEQEQGNYRVQLEDQLREPKTTRLRKTIPGGFGCCSRAPRVVPDFMNPPQLKQWLAGQNLGSQHARFVQAGYDDYEWLLIQMNSAHPLTDGILAHEIGIAQASTRSRILHKLQEG